MLDMSWGEVMLIGGVALIVIGPKDLPKALRTVGQITGKMRRMAGEFQTQFNDAMREAELDDVKKQVDSINQSVSSLNTSFNPLQTIRDEIKTAVEAPVAHSDERLTSDEAQSLVLDEGGIYFDATRPSDLECILNEADFSPQELADARKIILALDLHGLGFHPAAILPIAALGRNLADVNLRVEDCGKRVAVFAAVAV